MIDFIIIGAQKSGTTAAAHNLNKHPAISVFSKTTEYQQREIEFFNQHWERGKDWYFDQLPKSGLIGEKTAELFHRTICHDRIKMVNPDVKLDILLRNPVDRAYSQWKMAALDKKDESRSFQEVIFAELKQIDEQGYKDNFYNIGLQAVSCWREGYLMKGFYAEQLNSIYNLFPKDQVFIGVSEKILRDKVVEYNKVFSFLGVEPLETNFEDKFQGRLFEPMAAEMRILLKKLYREHNQSLFDLIGYEITEWQ